VRAFGTATTATLGEHRDRKVELPCVVTQVARQISKKNGSEWGRLTVEDFYGTASVLAFGDVWSQYRDVLQQDAPVLIRGAVSGRDRDEDAPPIFLDSAVSLTALRGSDEIAIEIALSSDVPDRIVTEALATFRRHPGRAAVFVHWLNGHADAGANGGVRLRSKSITVEPGEALIESLRDMFGADRIRFVRTEGEHA
jgi:DNA polymerase-3 subunit alpha